MNISPHLHILCGGSQIKSPKRLSKNLIKPYQSCKLDIGALKANRLRSCGQKIVSQTVLGAKVQIRLKNTDGKAKRLKGMNE